MGRHLPDFDRVNFPYEQVDSLAAVMMEEIGQRAGITARQSAMIADWFTGREATRRDDLFAAGLIVRQVLTDIYNHTDPRRRSFEYIAAWDFRESNEISMRAVARASGVSVAAISKNVLKLQTDYNLARAGSFNKSPQARATYRITNGKGNMRADDRAPGKESIQSPRN